jgi:hypothetical protein
MSSRRPLDAVRSGGPESTVALFDASGTAVLNPAPGPGRAAPPAQTTASTPTSDHRPASSASERRLVWLGRLAIAGLLVTGLLVTISAASTQSFLPL